MLLKTQTTKKAAANLATQNLFIDIYITNNEKNSKLIKASMFFKVPGIVNDINRFLNPLSKAIEKQL